jgi:DNA-binding NarL/FixJ family response regulator
MDAKIRIFIVDDYPAVRADLRTILELADGFEVVGESASTKALAAATAAHPDIILIDMEVDRRVDLPISGSDITRQIKTCLPGVKVIVLTAAGGPVPAAASTEGADTVFIKGTDTSLLLDRVRNFKIEKVRDVPMQNTSELQIGVVEQAKSAVQERAKAAARLAYIDVLRMVLIILVIMVHAAVTYGSLGDWTYEDPVQDELSAVLLSLFVISSQSFFMGLFFFYAGYFTPGSYDRKGPAQFWKDRLLRLGIPLVAYTWFLSKVPNYIDAIANQGMQMTFGQYFVSNFWSDADEGPTWFLFALLIFIAAYTLWREATSSGKLSLRLRQMVSRLPVPSTRVLLSCGLLMALFTFLISQIWPLGEMTDIFEIFSLQFQFFPSYIILFIAGILAYRSGWLTRLPATSLRFWGWLSAALLAALPALLILGGAADDQLDFFMGGWNWRSISLCLWLGLACISFSMTLTLWLRDRVMPGSRLAAWVGPNNFAAYLIHPLVLVPITWGLSYLPLHSMAKFGLASASTMVAAFLIASALRKIPGLRQIL